MEKKPTVRFIDIDEDRHGQRLDNFLMAQFRQCPRQLIYKLIRQGQVRVNKKRAKPKDRLQQGDRVRIPPVHVESSAQKPLVLKKDFIDKLEQAIIFEDESLLVVNKPAHLAVHGGSFQHLGLIESLKQIRQQPLELAHRLDKETSGCLLIAKSRQVLVKLHQQFRDHQIAKSYDLWVEGLWPKRLNKIEQPLKKVHHANGGWQVYVNSQGKEAVTTFEFIAKKGQVSHVRARLKTGRTHQIRVHAQYAGHSILGDPKYGQGAENLKLCQSLSMKRMALHASQLGFVHPKLGTKLRVEAPLDEFLQQIKDHTDGV